MGWFWSDTSPAPVAFAPHPVHTSGAAPPPECPMHVHQPSTTAQAQKSSSPPGGCPVKHSNEPPSRPSEGSCPVKQPKDVSQPLSASVLSKLNPLNYMLSNLSQSRAEKQTIHLPVEREISSIPRGDSDSNWEYPSPQQMYNAILRKGYDDTPEDAVESMVAVHNFLNEGAWAEIVEWEQTFAGGLLSGWRKCQTSKEVHPASVLEPEELPQPRLLRFQGRPKDMTPKATILQLLGQVYPSKFGNEPPFDRHDWFVQRQVAPGQTREVRYVIDYYSAPPEPTGEPVFYLDVRPAVDGPTAAVERLMKWGSGFKPSEIWQKASGASARAHTK